MVLALSLLGELVVGALGLFALVRGAEVTVSRVVALAVRYEVPDVLVAMTVVAVGTSLPELAAHVVSSLGILSGTLEYRVASAAVLGGNVGSSTTQQLLLVGLFLIGYGRYSVSREFLWTSYAPMLGALVLTLLVAWDGTVSRLDGLLLLSAFAAYLYVGYARRRRGVILPEGASANPRRDALVALAGLTAIVAGAVVVFRVVEAVIEALALGGSMVGVVTLGLAAALPELSTVVEALRRRVPTLALGTLIGSNVVNPLLGIGLGGVVSTYYVPRAIVLWDLPFKLVVGVGLVVVVLRRPSRTLTRRDGALLVVLYFGYVSVRLLLFAEQ